MFGLYSKAPTPTSLAEELRPQYARVAGLIGSIDGNFLNLFEAGIFVSSVATMKILTFKKTHGPTFSNDFNRAWVDYLSGSYAVDGASPSKKLIVERLQEKFPVYRELFLRAINPNQRNKAHDNAVQLTWELFTNCTGKQKPESAGGFVKLVATSAEIVTVGSTVFKAVHE